MDHFRKRVFAKLGTSFLWIDSRIDRELVLNLLSDLDSLLRRADCRIIKDQKKIKVGYVHIEIQGRSVGIYIKRYNAFSWRYRLGSLFFASGAARALKGALVLLKAGIATARPLAAVESRSRGMLQRSFYVSEEIERGKTADAYWRERLDELDGVCGFQRRRSFLQGLAKLFRSLHDRNIYHNDLKDANILVAPCSDSESEDFYLLDLEGIRSYRDLSQRRRVKNLVQLNRTFGRYLRWSAKLRFLKCYLGGAFSDRKVKRFWVKKILADSRRLDRRRVQRGLPIDLGDNAAHEV